MAEGVIMRARRDLPRGLIDRHDAVAGIAAAGDFRAVLFIEDEVPFDDGFGPVPQGIDYKYTFSDQVGLEAAVIPCAVGAFGEVEGFVWEGIMHGGLGGNFAGIMMECCAGDIGPDVRVGQHRDGVLRMVPVVIPDEDFGGNVIFSKGHAHFFNQLGLFGRFHPAAGIGFGFVIRFILWRDCINWDSMSGVGLNEFHEVVGVGGVHIVFQMP